MQYKCVISAYCKNESTLSIAVNYFLELYTTSMLYCIYTCRPLFCSASKYQCTVMYFIYTPTVPHTHCTVSKHYCIYNGMKPLYLEYSAAAIDI